MIIVTFEDLFGMSKYASGLDDKYICDDCSQSEIQIESKKITSEDFK